MNFARISVIVQCLSYHNSLKASLNCEHASRFFHSLTKAKINILSVVVVAIPVKLQIASWQLFCTFMLKQYFFAYSIRVTWRYAGESLWNASTNVVPKIFPVKRWDTKVFALSLGLETRLLNTHSSSSFLHPGTITQISTWNAYAARRRETTEARKYVCIRRLNCSQQCLVLEYF